MMLKNIEAFLHDTCLRKHFLKDTDRKYHGGKI